MEVEGFILLALDQVQATVLEDTTRLDQGRMLLGKKFIFLALVPETEITSAA